MIDGLKIAVSLLVPTNLSSAVMRSPDNAGDNTCTLLLCFAESLQWWWQTHDCGDAAGMSSARRSHWLARRRVASNIQPYPCVHVRLPYCLSSAEILVKRIQFHHVWTEEINQPIKQSDFICAELFSYSQCTTKSGTKLKQRNLFPLPVVYNDEL